MTLKAEEIPSLLFWLILAGVSFYVTSKVVGQVSEKITQIFQ